MAEEFCDRHRVGFCSCHVTSIVYYRHSCKFCGPLVLSLFVTMVVKIVSRGQW